MNIFSVFSTQGSQGLGAVKGVEAAQSAKAAARQEGVGEVHDAVTLSVDAVKAADSTADIRFDRVNAIKAAIADFEQTMQRLYQQAGGAGAQAGPGAAAGAAASKGGDEDIKDADFEVK